MLGDGENAGGRRRDRQEGHPPTCFPSPSSDVCVPGAGDLVRGTKALERELLHVGDRLFLCQFVVDGVFDVVAQFN